MRRIILGSTAFWLVGGALLAADEPRVTVPGILPEYTPPAGSMGGNKVANGLLLQPLQSLATPTGVAIKQVSAQSAEMPAPVPAPPPAAVSEAPMVETVPAAGSPASDNSRLFGRLDYLQFWIRRNSTPPLVQVLPAGLANQLATGGDLPPNAAQSIFGPRDIDHGSFEGARLQLGTYFDDSRCWGVDGSYLQLFQKSDSFEISSPGVPVIGRSYHDVGNNKDTFLAYSLPDGSTTGYIRVNAPTQAYTFDANLRTEGPSVLSDRVDYFIGLRYLNLHDSVTIDSGATITSATAPPFTITSHEAFKATNEFYASQVGLETNYRWGCFSLEVIGKFAVGWVRQDVRIDGGSTTQTGSAPPVSFPNQSILYVQPTNAGNFSRNRFAVLPEALFTIGYQITPHLRATIGYDVWDLTSVIRSGQAIDPNINPAQTKYLTTQGATTVRQPAFNFSKADDWWANGVTAGLAFKY